MMRTVALTLMAGLTALLLPQVAAAQNSDLNGSDGIEAGSFMIVTVPIVASERLTQTITALEGDFGLLFTADWPLASISLHCLVFDIRSHTDIDALIVALASDPRVTTAQRNNGYALLEDKSPTSLIPVQWGLDRMNVLAAHEISTGDGVRVGIIDTGVDIDHPDLLDRVVETRDFIASAPDHVTETHGTAVAAVIGAAFGDTGMLGVAPGAELISLRACRESQDTTGHCTSLSVARAINFAILHEIDILNLSLGGPDDPLLGRLIQTAVDRGMVVVAAGGEAPEELPFPASQRSVIAAGAGASRVPAPMVDVISAAPGGTYRFVSGSSIAAAHVSGVAALMRAHRPGMSAADIFKHLTASVGKKGPPTMIDACRALEADCI